VDSLQPDIVVLCEVTDRSDFAGWQVHKIGATEPGVALVVRNGYSVSRLASNDSAPSIVGGFTVTSPVRFNLVAAWPVKTENGPSYHQILLRTLEHFSQHLAARPAILAGDLNSSSKVSGQEASHPKFVLEADKLGLISAYHAKSGEEFGDESMPTYRHGKNAPKWFHIDYCFVSRELAESLEVEILRDADWEERSDHLPIVLEIPDAALAAHT